MTNLGRFKLLDIPAIGAMLYAVSIYSRYAILAEDDYQILIAVFFALAGLHIFTSEGLHDFFSGDLFRTNLALVFIPTGLFIAGYGLFALSGASLIMWTAGGIGFIVVPFIYMWLQGNYND